MVQYSCKLSRFYNERSQHARQERTCLLKKITAIILIFFTLISVFSISANAASYVKVYIDNAPFSGDIQVRNQTTYVEVRKFATQIIPSASVTYNSSARTLSVKTSSLVLNCEDGKNYIVANGRYLYYDQPIFMKNGVMYAPIMQLYRAFGAGIKWSNSIGGFYVTKGSGTIRSGDSFYNKDALYWLSRIISAEAKGEPLRGKIAVGNVILNRVRSGSFPNTIYGVIFDKKFGVQFTPASNGTIYAAPTEESIIAAKISLEGYSLSTGILYFVNPVKAPNSWASKNRSYFGKIGNHVFYY